MSSQRVAEAYAELVRAFERGEVPKALSLVFLMPRDVPSRAWSWRNRTLIALHGHSDARTFRQWKLVGRSVKRGARACFILRPIVAESRKKRRGEELEEAAQSQVPLEPPGGDVRFFAAVPVFGASQTEGAPLPYEEDHRSFFASLPWLEVARAWGIRVEATDRPDVLGTYNPDVIRLRVKNLAVWAHELIHAAQDRLGRGREPGPLAQACREVVAELGAAVLLRLSGHEEECDLGGAFRYLYHVGKQVDFQPIAEASRLTAEICEAVELILADAARLSQPAGLVVEAGLHELRIQPEVVPLSGQLGLFA